MRLTPSAILESAVYGAYAALWTLLLPFLALYLAVSPRHRPVLARFRAPDAAIPRDAVWVHACSVGEVNAARPLITALQDAMPGIPVWLTVSTRTGQAHAAEVLKDIPRAWFPLDHPCLAARFMNQARPRALVLIETELWPAVLRAAAARRVPVILANGRLSDKHFERYQRIPWLTAPMMRALTAAAMQSERYANRIEALGMPPGRIHVMGSVKFDGAQFESSPEARAQLADAVQPGPEQPLIVVGSSRPGDEARAVDAWQSLKAELPGLQLAIALRHPGRIADAERDCGDHLTRRRSACTGDDPWRGEAILLVDTLGELLPLYECATVVIIGGSFDPVIQGHNPIEPAALGKPVVYGPHMRNFEEASHLLVEAGAALQVDAADALHEVLHALLTDAARREAMGEAGKAAVSSQQGAAARMAVLIAQTLENA